MIDAQTFKDSMKLFASGVTILTWQEEDGVQGITVSAFSSLSLNPPLVLFCIAHSAYVHSHLDLQKNLCINILAEGQSELAYQFAGANRENLEELLDYENSENQPMLKNAQANLLVHIRERITQGDHDIFIAEVQQSKRFPERKPLLYHNSRIFS